VASDSHFRPGEKQTLDGRVEKTGFQWLFKSSLEAVLTQDFLQCETVDFLIT
jgi:hypothetical protein